MKPMARQRVASPSSLLLSCVLIVGLSAATDAEAAPRNFVFELTKIELKAKGAPAKELGALIRKTLTRKIDAAERLLPELPRGAPDPKSHPKEFVAFMKKQRLNAYKVNVEVTEYERAIEAASTGRGKLVTVRIALRIFGETVPDRSMAFTGGGSATVKLAVGSKVRDKDVTAANNDAIDLAIDDALATSIKKLDGPEKKKKSSKRRKR